MSRPSEGTAVPASPPLPAPSHAGASTRPAGEPLAFHVLTKPIGPICNLDCTYCFYLHKENFFPRGTSFRMTEETLERFVQQYIEAQDVDEINFAWQGGEPTLLGLDFFRKAIELQRRHCPPGKTVHNAFQTNGVLLDDEWGAFLKAHDFLVGLSIDGPRALHDRYRVDKHGGSSFEQVMRGLRVLQRHQVRVNALVCVNRETGVHGLEIYRFLRDECGFEHIQFIPIVEKTDFQTVAPGVANPRGPDPEEFLLRVTPWSVRPEQYGRFLCAVFDEWLHRDVGKVFVQLFEQTLACVLGMPASLCVYRKHCGRALAIEHDGGLYSCDHFVYPEHRLGHIGERTIRQMVQSPQQDQFGRDKFESLPRYCRGCQFLELCYGECPKNRFIETPEGEPGLNYLCAGLLIYFQHVTPYLGLMARELRSGREAAGVMRQLQDAASRRGAEKGPQPAGAGALPAPTPARDPRRKARPNAPCPCGSGRKFKRCCGKGR